jgi:cathepsin F
MKCFKVILAFLLMACIFAQEVDQEKILYEKFLRFQEKYQKNYDSLEEFNKRFNIFKQNYLHTHTKQGQITGTVIDDEEMRVGTTQFSDLTPEEFQTQILIPNMADMVKGQESVENFLQEEKVEEGEDRNLQTIPATWDWRQHGAVTSVKSQGSCGGCWAFTAAANIEGQYAIKHKTLMSFSEQQMIDCSYGDSGCAGGIMHSAYDYLRRAGGLQAKSSYPYKGFRAYCAFKPALAIAKVASYSFAPSINETSIMSFLYSRGPLGITVNANTLQFYRGGVINVPYSSCPYAPNHGVVLVGYGTTASGIPYWIIKNSWGAYWGEGGYFRIARNKGLCGLNRYVITANLA